MVFGWGKKKQEESDAISQTRNTLRLDEIESVLSTLKEEKRKKIATQSKPLFSEMQEELNSIYKIIDHLKNDDLKVDDIEKILRVLVVRSKTEVIDVITKESKKSLPTVSNYEDVLKTADAASHSLKKIGDVLGKHSRIIHVFAKKYAQDLKDHLELVTKNNTMITKMISDYSSLELSSNMIKELAQKITESSRDLQEIDHHIAKLRESKDTAESLYQATQKHLAEIRSSPEHAGFLQLQDKVRHVRSQEENLDKEIDDEFSKASRPLGKYVYVTSLDKSLKLILERLVERPSTVIMSESKDSIVMILESCMKGIVSGTVSVKETDKSVDHIASIISSLDAMISKKNNIKTQIQDLEQQITKFDYKKLESLEKQQAKSKSDVEDSEFKIQALQSDLAQKTSQKQKLVSDLESVLERLGTKYQIILD
ncbi:MAG: hypothetical protein JRZ94_03130 [Nitrososphaerota archaeon]|nr:hypothetical protein [Nitrososphaerota archaeon]